MWFENKNTMKKIILFLVLHLTLSAFGQGMMNNGAVMVLQKQVYLKIENTSLGNFTNANNGEIKNENNGGTISLQKDWVNNASNVVFQNDGISVILDGDNQFIRGTNTTHFYNLELDGTGVKTMAVSTKVGGITDLTGTLKLNSLPLALNQHQLEITNGATNGIQTDGIQGRIISEHLSATNLSTLTWNTNATGTYIFPFGTLDATDFYIPLSLNKTSNGANEITTSTRTTTHQNTPWTTGVTNMTSVVLGVSDASEETAIDRWYEIQPSQPLAADVTYSYRGAENTTTVSPTGIFGIQRWNGYWENQTGSGNGVTTRIGTVTAPNQTAFGTLVLTTLSASGPLPIELINFSGTCENGVVLKWATATETNVHHFIIESSRDGVEWKTLVEVDAVGNSSVQNDYQWKDANGFSTLYYRLSSVDNDGKTETFFPISMNCENTAISWMIYPNPASTHAMIALTSTTDEETIITIVDMKGREIDSREVQIRYGNNLILMDVQQLSEGTYIIKINNQTVYKPLKLVVVK